MCPEKEFEPCGVCRSEYEILLKEVETLRAHSRVDYLTGLHNRKAFDGQLQKLAEYAIRNGEPLSLIMIDIDGFKSINDTYGHSAGDVVLVEFARILLQYCRESDFVARVGGEEFAVICMNTDMHEAALAAERLRIATEDHLVVDATPFSNDHAGTHIAATASFGVSQMQAREVIHRFQIRVDKLLLSSKQQGKNKVVAVA